MASDSAHLFCKLCGGTPRTYTQDSGMKSYAEVGCYFCGVIVRVYASSFFTPEDSASSESMVDIEKRLKAEAATAATKRWNSIMDQ